MTSSIHSDHPLHIELVHQHYFFSEEEAALPETIYLTLPNGTSFYIPKNMENTHGSVSRAQIKDRYTVPIHSVENWTIENSCGGSSEKITFSCPGYFYDQGIYGLFLSNSQNEGLQVELITLTIPLRAP